MSEPTVGFAVIYRFRLRAGLEKQFREGWESVTKRLMTERGALGSRLHRAEDGTWVAYAQWPSKPAWERSRAMGPVDAEGTRLMREAEEDAFPPVLLEPMADYLRPLRARRGG